VYVVITSVVAGISVLCSLLVVLTFVVFPVMRRRMLMKMIAYISLADLISNIAYIPLMRPAAHSGLCIVEAFINITVYPCSWLWTLALVYSLYYLAHYARTPTRGRMWKLHVFCWGIPICLSCISLTFTRLGVREESPDYEVCNIHHTTATIAYHLLTYYGMFGIVVCVMFYLMWKIRQLEFSNDPRVFNVTFTIARASLHYYPSLLLLCWLPHFFVEFVIAIFQSRLIFDDTYFYTDLLKISHGTFAALLFFMRSREARRAWWLLLCQCDCNMDDSADINMMERDFSLNDDVASARDFSLFIEQENARTSSATTESTFRSSSFWSAQQHSSKPTSVDSTYA
jgi:hypothetical protein